MWLGVYYEKICIYPIFYLLMGDYKGFRFWTELPGGELGDVRVSERRGCLVQGPHNQGL